MKFYASPLKIEIGNIDGQLVKNIFFDGQLG
jgi:hypothetical protein